MAAVSASTSLNVAQAALRLAGPGPGIVHCWAFMWASSGSMGLRLQPFAFQPLQPVPPDQRGRGRARTPCLAERHGGIGKQRVGDPHVVLVVGLVAVAGGGQRILAAGAPRSPRPVLRLPGLGENLDVLDPGPFQAQLEAPVIFNHGRGAPHHPRVPALVELGERHLRLQHRADLRRPRLDRLELVEQARPVDAGLAARGLERDGGGVEQRRLVVQHGQAAAKSRIYSQHVHSSLANSPNILAAAAQYAACAYSAVANEPRWRRLPFIWIRAIQFRSPLCRCTPLNPLALSLRRLLLAAFWDLLASLRLERQLLSRLPSA